MRATESELLLKDVSYRSVKELRQSGPKSQASDDALLGSALNIRHLRQMNRSTSHMKSPLKRKRFDSDDEHDSLLSGHKDSPLAQSVKQDGYSIDECLISIALILLLSAELVAALILLKLVDCPWVAAVIPATIAYSLLSLVLYRQYLWTLSTVNKTVVLALKFVSAKSFFGVLSSYCLAELYPASAPSFKLTAFYLEVTYLISLGLWVLFLAFHYRSINAYYASPLAAPTVLLNTSALTHLFVMVFLDLNGYYTNHALLLAPPITAALITTVALLFASKSPRWPLTSLVTACVLVLLASREFVTVLVIAGAAQVEAYGWAMRERKYR